MLAAAAAGTSQPILAGLLGLGAAGLAGAVVAMAWSVHARQIRLAELLVRRQFTRGRMSDVSTRSRYFKATFRSESSRESER